MQISFSVFFTSYVFCVFQSAVSLLSLSLQLCSSLKLLRPSCHVTLLINKIVIVALAPITPPSTKKKLFVGDYAANLGRERVDKVAAHSVQTGLKRVRDLLLRRDGGENVLSLIHI